MAGINIIQAAETAASLKYHQPGARFPWSRPPGKGRIKHLISFCCFFFFKILLHTQPKFKDLYPSINLYLWCSIVVILCLNRVNSLNMNNEALFQTHTLTVRWSCKAQPQTGAPASSLKQLSIDCRFHGCIFAQIFLRNKWMSGNVRVREGGITLQT